MDRRDFLIGATGSVAALAMAKTSMADSHGAHGAHAAGGAGHAADRRVRAVRETTAACEEAAAECVRHCLVALGAGETELADCMRSVLRMQSVVTATRAVTSGETSPDPRTRELVAVCAKFCDDCAAACEPHAEKHAACKDCLEACKRCIEACDAYVA